MLKHSDREITKWWTDVTKTVTVHNKYYSINPNSAEVYEDDERGPKPKKNCQNCWRCPTPGSTPDPPRVKRSTTATRHN